MTFSVVIPAFNGSRFIEQAILSVLNQQRAADEILVLDDNSTDDTLAICRKYQHRIRIIANSSGPSGFVKAWNNAVTAATGDFVSILHQDDLLEPEFLSMAEILLDTNPDVRHMFCTCRYIDADNKYLSSSYQGQPSIRHYTGQEYLTAYQNVGTPHIHRCPGVLTHKSIFDQCRYNADAGHIADDDFFYRVGMYTDVVGILHPLASFRLHSGSVTGRSTDIALVRQLATDYLYQCRQWKGKPFILQSQYDYFTRNAGKFIRRLLGYGICHGSPSMIIAAFRLRMQLKKIIARPVRSAA
jgi:glycosyltransferase involved in cell wall biosynthesis